MKIPSDADIRAFYRDWLKEEYDLEHELVPASVINVTKAALLHFNMAPVIDAEEEHAHPFIDGLDSL